MKHTLQNAIERATNNLNNQNALISVNTDKPPQIGFAYLLGTQPIVVVAPHPDDPTTMLCVPLYDRPDLEYQDYDQYQNDKPVCLALPIEGYGEAVLNYNRANWHTNDELSVLPLIGVFDRQLVATTHRDWLKTIYR